MSRCLITGCAGFVGSTFVDRLLAEDHEVLGIDNFSTGVESFLHGALSHPKFTLVRGDVLDSRALAHAIEGCDMVYHLAANADVRFGTGHPTRDFEQNARATLEVLEAMRGSGCKRIAFSSTGSIYGEARTIPTPEDDAIPIQTSLYGASKIAAEGFIEAYCEGFGFQSFIFRFVSLLGERYTHGHVIDFYRQLREHPERLHVLGNGKQRKSYLYVGDCVDAMLRVVATSTDSVNVYNLGTNEYCEVNDSIAWICERMGVKPEIVYAGGERGWIGDNPFIFLDTRKVRSTGWAPTMTIRQAIESTIDYLGSTNSITRP